MFAHPLPFAFPAVCKTVVIPISSPAVHLQVICESAFLLCLQSALHAVGKCSGFICKNAVIWFGTGIFHLVSNKKAQNCSSMLHKLIDAPACGARTNSLFCLHWSVEPTRNCKQFKFNQEKFFTHFATSEQVVDWGRGRMISAMADVWGCSEVFQQECYA